MTDETAGRVHGPKAARLGRWLRWTGGVVLLAVVPLACEISRWRPFSDRPSVSSESGPEVGGEDASEAGQAVSAWLRQNPVTGLAACVAVAGRVLWCSANGYADMESREPLTASSSMRLGSASKPVTSVLLARFVERGLLGLDRPVHELMPELPQHLGEVTPRQLASHTAGVRHYRWRFG